MEVKQVFRCIFYAYVAHIIEPSYIKRGSCGTVWVGIDLISIVWVLCGKVIANSIKRCIEFSPNEIMSHKMSDV